MLKGKGATQIFQQSKEGVGQDHCPLRSQETWFIFLNTDSLGDSDLSK